MTRKPPGEARDAGRAGAGGAGRRHAAATVPVTVTYLEMMSPEQRAPGPGWPEPTQVLRAERPTLSFYRYLYTTIGADWDWWVRRRLSDDELAAIIHDDAVEVCVPCVRGVPAGLAELDRRIDGEVEIAYFGLIPEYIGRGIGPALLDWALERAWGWEPHRVWLHTCSLDHPKALSVYQRAGFRVYDRQVFAVNSEFFGSAGAQSRSAGT